ncbi:hypothetical protein [Hoeflea prorocentri]|uniref:DUF35 domain-containing protein n=1 Tax=Hoeflea prorocentri TaxID=1922333 RepID=A0A9X3UFD7_9HYPH|nr:hypothetical protein [Hoeflea prorocentri]MCY6379808.1 hypothetical protein [Hoeflea prorocentri]MDA5397608.1 hypothetical protein [Hoeflea prorocentri]
MIPHRLQLDYNLAPGWLQPWVEALEAGSALARTCAACGKVSFVPLRTCTCGCAEGTWTPLPGTATLERRTEGADGSFALVTFDGADTSTVVRLESFPEEMNRGTIAAAKDGLPALVLRPLTQENTP